MINVNGFLSTDAGKELIKNKVQLIKDIAALIKDFEDKNNCAALIDSSGETLDLFIVIRQPQS